MHGGINRLLRWRQFVVGLIALATALCASASAHAQLLRGRGRPPEPEIIAFAGEPYGVGRWTVPLPQGVNPGLVGNSVFNLADKNGRVVFQAYQAEPVRAAARELLGRSQMATVYFLFTGDGPLELKMFTPAPVATAVKPERDPVAHAQLLNDWWVKYARAANRIDRPEDYPAVVDNYLLATLARRLNLPPASQVPPPTIRVLADSLLGSLTGGHTKPALPGVGSEQFDDSIGLLLGADTLRSELQTQVLSAKTTPPEAADQPLPAGFSFTPNVPEVLGNVALEPLASHVPEECFYLRFGNFPNYLWFRETMDRWSGDLRNLFNRRGLNYGMTARIERQLSLKESALAQLLGPTVIADTAVVGSDLFFREGAAMGVLFQARSSYALTNDFNTQRNATLQREPGCTQTEVDIAGHKVSFLSTTDNRVRSFYAIDGDFHFVTNSRHLVERFYEAGAGKGALGGTAEFKFARSLMPITKDYTVFGYLSSAFFQDLIGPHYQIEMQRRSRSSAEIDVAMVAQLAAKADGRQAKSIDELIAGQYLPAGFGQRADGSRLEFTADGEIVDSHRGARGSFLPTPDMPVEKATEAEARRYTDFAAWFQSKWSQIDPVVVGIRRETSKIKDAEHIVLDVQLTPLAAKNYETISQALGPIAKQRLAPVQGDVVSAEAILSGNLLASKGLAAPQGAYRMFGAFRNGESDAASGAQIPPAAGNPGPINLQGGPNGRGGLIAGVINNALAGNLAGGVVGSGLSMLPPFYFGAYPTPALFAMIGLGADVQVDANGYGRSANGLWERRDGKFTTASMQRSVLEAVTPQFKFVDAPRPAQGWLHIGDLGRSKLASTINGLFYRGAKNAALGNVRFLSSLNTQLRVPAEDCLKAAEQLTDAKLVCPVGGQYQLDQRAGGLPTWISTALPSDRMRLVDGLFEPAPASYTAPILNWLRGLEADLALDQRVLSLHVEVDMMKLVAAPAVNGATKPIPPQSTNPAPATAPPPTTGQPPKPAPPKREEIPPPLPRPAQ